MKKDHGKNIKHKHEHRDDKAPPQEEALAAPEEPAVSRDQMLRLQADFENLRKRTIKERTEWFVRANEDLMTELLPVLDHFDIGLRTAEEHGAEASLLAGFRLVYEQLLATLRKFGLNPIDSEGQVFDPHRHEAVTHLPSGEHPEGRVMVQTRRGYMLGDKLLRAAQVVVSSGSGGSVPADDAAKDASDRAGVRGEE